MMLQDPILLGNYGVSEGGIIEFDAQSFIEVTTSDKFRRIDGDQTMEIYIFRCMHACMHYYYCVCDPCHWGPYSLQSQTMPPSPKVLPEKMTSPLKVNVIFPGASSPSPKLS